MESTLRKNNLFIFVLILIFTTSLLFYLDWQDSHRKLTFAMLDVGQGDALFIESPTGTDILFDGGPQRKILDKIGLVVPTYDKTIDAIVVTNPDADHMGGFLEILQNYKVGQVFESGTRNDSDIYRKFKNEIKKQNIKTTIVQKGMKLDIGGGAYIDILFPDRDVSTWDRNDGSIVARLSYGETSVMLTGDSTDKTEYIVVEGSKSSSLESDILKVGHHGSRTSTSPIFLASIRPTYALISNGFENSYGHPHPETLDTLESFGIKVFRTDLSGSIIMKSDGQKETFSFVK